MRCVDCVNLTMEIREFYCPVMDKYLTDAEANRNNKCEEARYPRRNYDSIRKMLRDRELRLRAEKDE